MSKAPLRVGFIGAPLAGKSRVARGVAKEVEALLGHKPTIVDGYVDKLSKDVDRAFGQFATYSDNFMIAGVREAAEFKAIAKGNSVFQVGTLVESFLYQAIVADVELKRVDPQAHLRAAESAMSGVGLMLAEMFDYDAVIYLPYAPPKGKVNNWSQLVDSHIQNVTVSFGIPISIVEGTTSERISKSKSVIEYAYEKAPEVEVPVGQESGESGEDRS